MASPPFNINQALPGDSDIVSQFPLNERGTRDVIESWLLVNHNDLGQHKFIELPFTPLISTPVGQASVTTLYADQYGALHILKGTVDEYLSVPPGTIIYVVSNSGSLYNGYLWPNGTNASRTVFADLYSKIGTTFGIGDGVTTFTLPNIAGRVLAALTNLGGITDNGLLTAGYGPNGVIMGSVGGSQNVIIGANNLPITAPWQGNVAINGSADLQGGHTPTGSIGFTDLTHDHDYTRASNTNSFVQGGATQGGMWNSTVTVQTGTNRQSMNHNHSLVMDPVTGHTHTVTGSGNLNMFNNSAGGGQAMTLVQPTFMIRAMIKY